MNSDWSNLAKVVYARTYSRIDSGAPEKWQDTVERVIQGNIRNHRVSQAEVDQLRHFMLNRKATPAGRGLWFSGSPSHDRLGGEGLNNCWASTSEDWENFVIAQDLLMLGGGVGLSVEHRYTSKLPRAKKGVSIIHKNTKDADFIVPDSRQGWNELTRRVLESFFVTGKSFSYSTVCVRGAGEKIVGFGGVASGPLPLVNFIEKLTHLLASRSGRAIRPIDAADMICCIGEMVVSGNVRRSAIMIMGDAWDKDFLKAKRWDLGGVPNQRAMANFSVICDDIEDLHPLFWKTYEAGEPFGIVNRTNIQTYGRMGEKTKDSAFLVNPCFAPGTMVETKDGYFSIESLVGKTVSVWDGSDWVDVSDFRVTAENQPVVRVTFSDGTYERVTPYHKIVLKNGSRIQAQEAKPGQEVAYSECPNDAEPVTSNTIIDIRPDGVEPKVYCCTVPTTHCLGLHGGLLWGNCGEATLEGGPKAFENCNLQDIPLPRLASEEEFIQAAKLMFRYGKRITDEKYGWPGTEEIVKRNRRVGVGITGCLKSPLFTPKSLDAAYSAILEEDRNYSKELGIPESIRHTVIKPSGSISKVLDMGGYEGIHPAWSRYFIQRIRFSSADALVPRLMAAGHKVEPAIRFDGSKDPNLVVVDFYEKAPEGFPVADEGWDTWKQLEAVKMAQKHWADQSISVTVYYDRNDIGKLKAWLADNLKELKTISFLPLSEHGFIQAPKESITQTEYDAGMSHVRPLEDGEYGTGDLENMECAGGSCPIK